MNYSETRGFNYQPGYAAFGLKIWTEFDSGEIEKEIANGLKHFPKTNALRIWLSFDAYMYDKKLFEKNFDLMMNILGRNSLSAMPILFNNWHNVPDFGGVSPETVGYWTNYKPGVFTDYVDSIAGRYAKDERIFAWDLCNEPFNSGREELFLPWLELLADRCGMHNVTAPITVGVSPSIHDLETTEPFCGLLSPHLYFCSGSADDYRQIVKNVAEYAKKVKKPCISGETGWGDRGLGTESKKS